MNDEDSIVNINEDYLRRKLKDVLIALELDPTKYSWYLFRRGGTTLASKNHIDHPIIKTYLLYVDQDQDRAGLQISDVL